MNHEELDDLDTEELRRKRDKIKEQLKEQLGAEA